MNAVNERFEAVDMKVTPDRQSANLPGDTVRVHEDGKSEVVGSLLLVDMLIVWLRCLLLRTFA